MKPLAEFGIELLRAVRLSAALGASPRTLAPFPWKIRNKRNICNMTDFFNVFLTTHSQRHPQQAQQYPQQYPTDFLQLFRLLRLLRFWRLMGGGIASTHRRSPRGDILAE